MFFPLYYCISDTSVPCCSWQRSEPSCHRRRAGSWASPVTCCAAHVICWASSVWLSSSRSAGSAARRRLSSSPGRYAPHLCSITSLNIHNTDIAGLCSMSSGLCYNWVLFHVQLYPGAILEVCGWKLGRFPQVQGKLEGEHEIWLGRTGGIRFILINILY